MRVIHSAALTAAALLLASITSAQGLGDAAAREKAKRQASPAKPTKVYTDQEVASSPTTSADLPAESAPADAGGGAGGSEAKPASEGTSGSEAGGTSAAAAPAEEQTPEQKAAAEEEKAAAAEAAAK